MTSYAEMATRTAVGRAAVEAHGDRLRAASLGLVIVSTAPHECPLCAPLEGEVLALDGTQRSRPSTPPPTARLCACTSSAASTRHGAGDSSIPTAATP